MADINNNKILMEKSHFNIPLGEWISKDGVALVIIDMQKGIKADNYAPLECEKSQGIGDVSVKYIKKRLDAVIFNIQRILSYFRDNNLMVIFTKIGHLYEDFRDAPTIHKKRFNELMDVEGKKFYLMPGYRQYEILDEIKPLENEIILQKATSDTFTGTTLDLILRNNNINKLVICGALTSCCVESTARIAFDLGYLPTVVSDACIAADENFHKNALRVLRTYYSNVMATDETLEHLNYGSDF
ncbi:MAG: cysteine hydrolase [Actinobacteria bacterium]|nr:cysteine hydrolase [Actinomycetota bacterium]